MPEEYPPIQVSPQIGEKKSNKKKFLIILILFLVLLAILIGAWVYFSRSTSKETGQDEKTATTSAKTEEKKAVKTKVAFEDDNNIWVLDVTTKSKIQITNDATSSIFNNQPVSIDEDSFVYKKCKDSKCEIWLVDLKGSQFETGQFKKFNAQVGSFDVDSKQESLVYFISVGENEELHLLDLKSGQDKKIYSTTLPGRGGSSNDAFYTKLSPDGTKFLVVNTLDMENEEIVIWNLKGEEIKRLKNDITEPVWGSDSNTIFYRHFTDGVFSYNLETKATRKLSSDKDWNQLEISSDGKSILHNKGYSLGDMAQTDSNIYIFNIAEAKDVLLASSLVDPVWVGNEFIIANKLKKCANEEECLVVENNYVRESLLVVIKVSDKQSFEIDTQKIPTIADQFN